MAAIFKWIFLHEIILILIKISLKFVPSGPINNIPALVQIMAWRRSGDKLSEPMLDYNELDYWVQIAGNLNGSTELLMFNNFSTDVPDQNT